jgi:putative restriction endonuclease
MIVTKGIFLIRADSAYDDDASTSYQFPKMYLSRAQQFVGDWVVYMEPVKAGKSGYHAVAHVEQIIPDPVVPDMYRAIITAGSYLPLGRDIPMRWDGEYVERGLLTADGRVTGGKAVWAVRPLSDADFNRIVTIGLIEDEALLPRQGDASPLAKVQDEQSRYVVPDLRDRVPMLTNRIVRDRLFRGPILDAYDRRCALTGMKLINGGGRAETEAAHIVPVESGGPDIVSNGIALSGTVHWMFDRGLISLGDDGDMLLSSKINDIDGVSRILRPDRRAHFPIKSNERPHPRYLAWHREHCFHG